MVNDRLIARLRRIAQDPVLGMADRKAVSMAADLIVRAAQQTRVMTADEVTAAPAGTVLWEESYDGYDKTARVYPVLVDGDGRIGDCDCWTRRDHVAESMQPDEEGCRIRWWNRRPTDEERRQTPWGNA